MKRYVVHVSPYDKEGNFAQMTRPVTNAKGERLEAPEVMSGLHEIRRGLDVRAAGDGYLPCHPRDRIGDLLWYNIRLNLVVSQDVVEKADAEGLTLDPTLYRWPLHVVNSTNGEPRRNYVVLWSLKRWPVLDLSKAKVTFRPGTEVIASVEEWVFDETATPQYDLFNTKYKEWIASDQFRAFVERNRFTGFRLVPV